MKTIKTITLALSVLLLISCQKADDAKTAGPMQPQAQCQDSKILGVWVGDAGNTLEIKSDCTVVDSACSAKIVASVNSSEYGSASITVSESITPQCLQNGVYNIYFEKFIDEDTKKDALYLQINNQDLYFDKQ